MNNPIILGTAANIVASEVSNKLEQSDKEFLFYLITDIRDTLEKLHRFLSETNANAPDIFKVVVLNKVNDIDLYLHNRQRVYILSPVSNTIISLTISGLGTFDYTLTSGWNDITFPEDSRVKLSSNNASSTQNVLFKYTEIE
jgi:hypothetical protein